MPAQGADLRCGRWDSDGALLLPVRVQPRARHAGVGPVHDGQLKLSLTAPPVDGKANAQARELIAAAFGVNISQVTLLRGESGRQKLFRIEGPRHIPSELRHA
ncbi:MAG: DUF167 family protein [Gammaproteobacteria bacterium]|nr:DUF167 family protein [Gammaproteobacteria bacterium]